MFQELSSADPAASAAVVLAFNLPTAQHLRFKTLFQIHGREQWHLKRLKNYPRLAAAVELVLQTELGVLEVRVNPVTGRVLVRYDPAPLTCPVETLIWCALETSPLTGEEFRPRLRGQLLSESCSQWKPLAVFSTWY